MRRIAQEGQDDRAAAHELSDDFVATASALRDQLREIADAMDTHPGPELRADTAVAPA